MSDSPVVDIVFARRNFRPGTHQASVTDDAHGDVEKEVGEQTAGVRTIPQVPPSSAIRTPTRMRPVKIPPRVLPMTLALADESIVAF
jgi:hypothetical protein